MPSPALLSRRNFIAALGASTLTGCRTGSAPSVRILTGSGAGSASASLARLFARHLQRDDMLATVENLPRAGGKLAAQQLHHAPRDGTVISFISTGLLYAQLLNQADGDWDLADFEWIGNFSSDRRVLIVNGESGVTRFEDLKDRPKPLILAATTATSPSLYEARIIQHLTGARLTIIPGFVGGGRNLAIISGEVEGTVSALDGLTSLLEVDGMHVILRLNDLPIPAGTRGTAHKATLLRDVARGADAGPLLDLVSTHSQLGRILALPPRTPPKIVAAWRSRFARAVADPDFRNEAAAAGYALDPSSGAVVADLIERTLSQGRATIAAALDRAVRGEKEHHDD